MTKKKDLEIKTVGSHNIVGDHNIVAHITVSNKAPKAQKITPPFKEGVEYITESNKASLTPLFDKWVSTHNEIKQSPLSYPSARKKFNIYMNVTSYHQIENKDYEKARKYIQRQIAILNRMPSAKKKSQNWRTDRYRAIHTRIKEHNLIDWKAEYMAITFNKSSLTELDDDQLEAMYLAVITK